MKIKEVFRMGLIAALPGALQLMAQPPAVQANPAPGVHGHAGAARGEQESRDGILPHNGRGARGPG